MDNNGEVYPSFANSLAVLLGLSEGEEKAFENAGSLCHGWTALPVYYFQRLGIAKYKD